MNQEESPHAEKIFSLSNSKEWADALLQATNSEDSVLTTLIKWQYLLDADSGASFEEIKEFLNKNTDWPERKRLNIRAEMMLPESDIADDEIISWFGDKEPITGVGKIALADALRKSGQGSPEKIESLVVAAWIDGDFSEAREKYIIETYGKLISKEHDISRTDRLLWEGKTTPAERMLSRFDKDRQTLYQARMALQADKKNSNKLVSSLPKSLQNDIGLLYDRMVYRANNDDEKGVQEILLTTPKKVPYPQKWWRYRGAQVRNAIREGNIKTAKQLLENHAQEMDQEYTEGYADAIWLKGRLLLESKNHTNDAYQVFQKMFDSVKYPVSKARAAYWAARSASKSGDTEAANNWYNTASGYPTTFYGQLASAISNGTAPLNIPSSPVISSDIREEFESRTIVKAVKLCIAFEQYGLAEKIITHLVSNAEDENEAMLASELGAKAGKNYLSVRGSKKALRNNVVLVDIGYPNPKTPDDLALPRELALSIARQESEFNNLAKSPAGALGLMQILPSTARETAHKNDIDYDLEKLYEPEYNMQLGSLYLKRMVENYDGSIVMAIAAYNAGPGNIYKWVKKWGKPENNVDSVVDWIENIPFAETRNYVQRVLENLQIYRHMEAKNSSVNESAKLLLKDDLLRWQY